MNEEQDIIKTGARLLLQGKSIFQLEEFLKQNGIEPEEKAIFVDEIIFYSEVVQNKKDKRLKRLKRIVGTTVLIPLVVLFFFGFLGFVGIGLIGILLIFWTLQTLGVLGAKRTNKGKFNRH